MGTTCCLAKCFQSRTDEISQENGEENELLDDDGESLADEEVNDQVSSEIYSDSYLLLKSECQEIGPQEYEKKWTDYHQEFNLIYNLEKTPIRDHNLERILKQNSIYTLAVGKVDKELKMYVYCESQRYGYIFLLELRLDCETWEIQIKMKSERTNDKCIGFLRTFEKIIKQERQY